MVIDVHSHAWQYPEHFTDQFRQQATQVAKANESLDLTITYAAYRAGAQNCDKTIVFGGKARPRLDEREIDALIHRDSLDILGL